MSKTSLTGGLKDKEKDFLSNFNKSQCEKLYDIIDKSIQDMPYALSVLDTLGDLIRKKEKLQEIIKPEPWTNEIEPACSSWKDFN